MITTQKDYILFFLLITICYSNTFNSSWHFDDIPNIIENSTLHIDNLQPETLWKTLFAQPFSEGRFYRPISNLTFALNWYFGQENTFGYHLINLLIHIFTAVFLYKTSILLLHICSIRKHSEQIILSIALLSSIFWAINPTQIQAVTYIVQRMASMGAMFYIFAFYTYLRSRQSQIITQKVKHLILCCLFFLLALGCKENVVTLIPSLLLVELLFLERNDRFSHCIYNLLILANVLVFLAALSYFYSQNYFQTLTAPIGSRPFSLAERLMTQPSVLLFYLSLLLFPSPERLSIDHSFPLSTSLFQPWTTLPAIFIVLGLIIFAFAQRRKTPLLSFAILFFFINHLIESTIIPLEMVFEHRNYLPSMFLFLPIAAGIQRALDKTKDSSRPVHATLILSIPIIITVIGLGTYSRNKVWASEESLWTDALAKAPTNARPYAKLGEIYGWQKEKTPENLRTAVALLEKAIHLESPRTSFKAAIVGNIGKIYFNYGLLDLAKVNYQRSLDINPNFITSRFDLANALTMQGKFDQALDQIDQVIVENDLQSRFFNLKTHLLLWLDCPDEAATNASTAMHRTMVNKDRYFYICGIALSRAGHNTQGLWFLRQALKLHLSDRRILYGIIENRLLANDPRQAKKYADQLINQHSLPQIRADLERSPRDYSSVPVNHALISPIIYDAATNALSAMR